MAPGGYHDEVAVLSGLRAPISILPGAGDQRVSGASLSSLAAPTVWRAQCRPLSARVTPRNGSGPRTSKRR